MRGYGATSLALTFNRVADPSLTYAINASSDLVDWGTTPIRSSSGADNLPGPFTFTDTIDLAATSSRFLPLAVSYP